MSRLYNGGEANSEGTQQPPADAFGWKRSQVPFLPHRSAPFEKHRSPLVLTLLGRPNMKSLSRVWWVPGLRGLFALCYGMLAFLAASHALRLLILFFGIFALVDGLFALAAGIASTASKDFMRSSLTEGIIGVGIGAGVLLAPGIAEATLIYLVATWAILTGVFEIFAVDKKDKVTLNETPFGIFGVLSIVAGALLFFYPRQGAYALTWLLGGYCLIFGVTLLRLAMKLYRHEQHRRLHTPSHLTL